MPIVVDTSAVIACVLDEPPREPIVKLTAGHILIAPASLPYEVGNSLAAMFKRRALEVDEAIAAVQVYTRMPIELRAVDVGQSVQLAERLRIYAYDAYMLQCALEFDARLLTLDGGLRTAARAVEVNTIEVKP